MNAYLERLARRVKALGSGYFPVTVQFSDGTTLHMDTAETISRILDGGRVTAVSIDNRRH